MKKIVLIALMLALTGCAAMAERAEQQQAAEQELLAQLTPEQRAAYFLEKQRLAIEQQRANTAQIHAGLEAMH